jgi:hypothetical protein
MASSSFDSFFSYYRSFYTNAFLTQSFEISSVIPSEFFVHERELKIINTRIKIIENIVQEAYLKMTVNSEGRVNKLIIKYKWGIEIPSMYQKEKIAEIVLPHMFLFDQRDSTDGILHSLYETELRRIDEKTPALLKKYLHFFHDLINDVIYSEILKFMIYHEVAHIALDHSNKLSLAFFNECEEAEKEADALAVSHLNTKIGAISCLEKLRHFFDIKELRKFFSLKPTYPDFDGRLSNIQNMKL